MIIDKHVIVMSSDDDLWDTSHLIVLAHEDLAAVSPIKIKSLVADFYEQCGLVNPDDVMNSDDKTYNDAVDIWDNWMESERIQDFISYLDGMGYTVFAETARLDFFPADPSEVSVAS